jgi:UDPglucose--hexose-1-phosphate uridylyltransferase
MNKEREIQAQIVCLVEAAVQNKLIESTDKTYARNQVCDRLGLEAFEAGSLLTEVACQDPSIPLILENLVDDAVCRGVVEDLSSDRERLSANLVNCFLDKPSVIQKQFMERFVLSPRKATDWFYQYCRAANIIQTRQIARNIVYRSKSIYGDLDITINLSKPEKNPRDIAAARHRKSTGYPRCQLCIENEGYAGRIGYPARANHRMIRLELGGEPWYLQYSPYAYYTEHCIILSHEHREMHIDRQTIENLLSFISVFPHYFVGSNADLPIVGGSILTHDHYQGGRYELPMAQAREKDLFALKDFPGLRCSILHWPMSVLRIEGEDKKRLADAAEQVLFAWRNYSDPAAEIIALDQDGPHNTITPIARRRENLYQIDLVLRNNRQSKEHPLGIFHPHADVQHIKKENIGLIEVMGLAVLPGRLKTELEPVENYLQGQSVWIKPDHQPWAEQLRRQHPKPLSKDQARCVVRDAVARKFEHVLSDAGVFRSGESGQAALNRFIRAAGGHIDNSERNRE